MTSEVGYKSRKEIAAREKDEKRRKITKEEVEAYNAKIDP